MICLDRKPCGRGWDRVAFGFSYAKQQFPFEFVQAVAAECEAVECYWRESDRSFTGFVAEVWFSELPSAFAAKWAAVVGYSVLVRCVSSGPAPFAVSVPLHGAWWPGAAARWATGWPGSVSACGVAARGGVSSLFSTNQAFKGWIHGQMKALIYERSTVCTGANYEVSPQGPVCKLLKVSRLVDFVLTPTDNIAMDAIATFLHLRNQGVL